MKKLIPLLLGFCLSLSAQAAGFLSVGSSGLGPLTFDNVADPAPTNGWSTATFGNDATTYTNAAGLDANIQTRNATNIIDLLPQTATTNQMPSRDARFRYNTAGLWLQSRPTGNDYALLMATLRNDSGAGIDSVVISYDYQALVTYTNTIEESPELYGHRAFYSLTGEPGSWVFIPEFSGITNNSHLVVTQALSATWANGANLYLIWADDNGPASDGAPTKEGAYTIDNFQIQLAADIPVAIVTQPHSVTVQTCRATNLSVTVSGSVPHFQWFHTGVPIPNATNATYNIPSATSADNGSYFVHVSNSINNLDSNPATVTVTPDSVPPTVVSAPLVRCDGTEILVHFSELMDTVSSQVSVNYQVAALDGGTARTVLTAVLTNGTNVILTLNGPVQAAKNYELRINSAVKDCPGNGITTGAHVPLNYELCLLSFVGTTWKMETNGVDLGSDWHSIPNYDDSAWPVGQSVFDAKFGTNRPSIDGFTIMTWLPLTNINCCDVTNDIPAYYFRTHFNFPSAQVVSLTLRTLSDDFDVAWLNNQDTPAHIRPGLATNVDLFTYSGGNAVGNATAERFNLDPARLNYGGDNLIAAKIFQANPTSSDITFAYELTAIVSHFGPRLTITYSGGQVHITWPTAGFAGTMQLYQSNTADGSSGWTVVSGQTAGSANITPGGAGTARFYTVRVP